MAKEAPIIGLDIGTRKICALIGEAEAENRLRILGFGESRSEGLRKGIPPEVLTRLKDLWEKTKVIAGEVVSIGKIIVQKIFEFLKDNPKLTIGLAFGAAVSVLIAGVPFIGPILAPLAITISMIYFGGVGAAMEKGDISGSPLSAAIALANSFFELLMAIFNAIVDI